MDAGETRNCGIPSRIATLIRGQTISVLIAGTGIFASLLSSTSPTTNFPTLMNLFNYNLLSTYLARNRCKVLRECSMSGKAKDGVTDSWKLLCMYAIAALIDLEANFLVLMAYNYTSITSVMLLDCFTIPCAMALSFFFLGCMYSWKHFTGAIICVGGLVCIVLSDVSQGPAPQNAVYGDILCLCGCVLYAISNVLQEYLVKFHDRTAYMAYLGTFGSFFAFVQCMIVDLPLLKEANFTTFVLLCIGGFVGCLFLMYINTSAFLQKSDATLFNLSLLTSDVYAVMFSYFMYGHLVSWLYFLAFAMVSIGLVIYHYEKPPLQFQRNGGRGGDGEDGDGASEQEEEHEEEHEHRLTSAINAVPSSGSGSRSGGRAASYNPISLADPTDTSAPNV